MAAKRQPTEAELQALAKHRQNAPPAPTGHERSLKHGTRSERKLAPVRQKHADMLRADYPHLDARRVALLADRLAVTELAAGWLDEQGTVVRTKAGQVFDVADKLASWTAKAWQMLSEVEAECRESTAKVDLSTAMSEPDPVIRAALLRHAGIDVDLPESEVADA